jgi:uncharacterized protein YukE
MAESLQFVVRTATLRAVSGQMGDGAGQAEQIASAARSADVERKSWGLLGHGLGLYDRYTSARNSADKSISEIKSFLSDAQQALTKTADDYEHSDQAGSQALNTAGEGLHRV